MTFNFIKNLRIVVVLALLLGACNGSSPTARTAETFKIGTILVGPKNDAGWSQAHYEGLEYVQQKLPDVELDYVDKVNPGDRPNVQSSQIAEELIARGAKLIIFNSDDFQDDALEIAKEYPHIAVIHATGDYAWKNGKNYKSQPNLTNLMPKMEYARAIAGCAAALSTKTGKIGFLGPLINDETRRLVSAAYLGSQYCWQTYRRQKPEDLEFKVTWIGFWFNIPGVTLDPTKVADDFYNSGFDVVMSGLDTPEAAVQAKKAANAGKDVQFLHYTLRSGCDLAPEICLGVPIYNWGPSYLEAVEAVKAGTFQGEFIWVDPDWEDINNPDTSAVGFVPGNALSAENREILQQFIRGLGDRSIIPFRGPLKFQDGTEFLQAGETATPQQIWYLPQLLEGIDGPSR